ncbi:hypothetical protein CH275_16025 [Rhodococcus sp. 06-235-1A]|uniref:holin n=1 Tax=Rhodococcus sp. 06-235-1A TaxID=2022508 RepID=UPI000B9AC8FB|nr:holin [Rhodococcus sp. 06-235-1A]OZD03897.1 hypothetical protein CH275_16025 [Rhodococcus sp. 06-235-1A]
MAASDSTVSVEVDLANVSVDTKAFWLDLADRASKTFVQNVLIFLGAGATILSVSWPAALSSAGLATLASVLLALSTATLLSSGNFLIDLADRAARTFTGTLVAAIPVAGGFGDVQWDKALTLAGTAVLVSILTSVASMNLGSAKGLPSLAPVGSTIVDLDEDEYSDIASNESFFDSNDQRQPYVRYTDEQSPVVDDRDGDVAQGRNTESS